MNSEIRLDRKGLAKNLEFLRSIIHPKVRVSSVVKGNAYGHGLDSFVPMAESAGFDHFSVFCSEEALRMKPCLKKPDTEIMIMGYIDPDHFEWIITEGISFFVFDFDRLSRAHEIAGKVWKPALVHIELETGMNRTGFSEKDLDRLASMLTEHKDTLRFVGLCTHFAGAESISNYVRIQNQKQRFQKMTRILSSAGLKPEIKHTCCSAAAIRFPEMHLDLVRIGILQYGFWPSREVFIEYLKGRQRKVDPLRRIISWESSIMNIKAVEMGEFVGYGTSYLAQKDMKIAVVPVGYSHGFSRSLGNVGRVLVNGIRTAVLGTVNMNCLTIDVTDVTDVNVNDAVTLIGRNGEHEISVASFSELSEQVNYELLTRLPESIPRRII